MPGITDTLDVIRDPIVQTGVLAVIGAVVTRIMLRHRPTRRLVGQLAFFAALTAHCCCITASCPTSRGRTPPPTCSASS